MISVPFLILIFPYIASGEFNLFGFFSLKWLITDIRNIQKHQLANQAVTINNQKWFWIDASNIAHQIPDFKTALFLSKGKGIINVQENEIGTVADLYPSVRYAKPMHNGNKDVFILYNDTLYYQTGLGFIFWLAAINNVKIGTKFSEWKKDNISWIEEISHDVFLKYKGDW